MMARRLDHLLAGAIERRAREHGGRVIAGNARLLERFARKIQPSDSGILVEVTQDIGELQRSPEMVGKFASRLWREAENGTESRPTALATRSQ